MEVVLPGEFTEPADDEDPPLPGGNLPDPLPFMSGPAKFRKGPVPATARLSRASGMDGASHRPAVGA